MDLGSGLVFTSFTLASFLASVFFSAFLGSGFPIILYLAGGLLASTFLVSGKQLTLDFNYNLLAIEETGANGLFSIIGLTTGLVVALFIKALISILTGLALTSASTGFSSTGSGTFSLILSGILSFLANNLAFTPPPSLIPPPIPTSPTFLAGSTGFTGSVGFVFDTTATGGFLATTFGLGLGLPIIVGLAFLVTVSYLGGGVP